MVPSRRDWLVVLALLGCSGAQRGSAPRGPVRARDYLPLAAGAAWSYDTDTGLGGGTVLSALTVVRAEPPRYLVRSGTHTEQYELRADGVVREGDYVLRDPLRAGTTWEARDGARYELRAVDLRRAVPAGTFTQVVEVARTSPTSGITTTTWFAPRVGVIEVVAESTSSRGAVTRVRSTLRGFTLGEEG